MIEWQFYIDELEVEEPGGFSDIIFQLTRDPDWHGVTFEASDDDLQFYGAAATYLRAKKQSLGLKSNSVFIANLKCDEDAEFEEVVRAKINFGKYKEGCGNDCFVSVMVEQANCTMIMRNRYDQKVDLSSVKGFDGFTQLENYSALLMEMTPPGKAIQVSIEGLKGTEPNIITGSVLTSSNPTTIFRPTYNDQKFNSIDTGQLIPINDAQSSDPDIPGPMTPQVLYEEAPVCFDGIFTYSFIHKGRFSINNFIGNANLNTAKLKVVRWDGVTGSVISNGTLVQEIDLGISGLLPITDEEFNETLSGTINDLVEGEGVYSYLELQFTPVGLDPVQADFTVEFDPETYMLFRGEKLCDPTTARVSMINEVLSRVTEAITNGCLKVKSNYYGRTDSQPYDSDQDGCGGLRVLTNGLFIRKAANDPKHFLSLKELFEGLNPIDNIGMGIEPDPARPGFDLLRIEDVSYFYQDKEILYLPLVPQAEIILEESEHYSIIKVGYEKWETEGENGLDEIHANREFRTSLNSVVNTKPIVSKFIAGSYPIEITRQQNFAESGGADNKFDNDTFIICVRRNGIYYNSVEVEQNNVLNPANFYSPQTIYNFRIRPWYNLMRWFKSVANSYANLTDTDNRLFFSQGTGNYKAEGELFAADDDECKLENGVKAENRNMSKNDFAFQVDYLPLWKPETARVKYPLSLKDYKTLKANPRGYILVQCGTGENFIKGYIKLVRYSPTKGEAEFNLKLKWQ